MREYHKIKTVWERNPDNMRYLLEGRWALPEFEYLKDNVWHCTEKIDGTNIRVMYDGEVSFGGKTDNAQLYVPLLDKLEGYFKTVEAMQVWKGFEGKEVCIYGEGYGAKIQKGGENYRGDGVDFVIFDILIDGAWLDRKDMVDIGMKFGVKPVPIVFQGTLEGAIDMVREGFKSQWGDFPAEGLVCKPAVGMLDRRGQRIITKIKARDFEVKGGKK